MQINSLCKNLTFQVVLAIILGILAGIYFPDFSKQMQPLAGAFIKMIKMVISPIVFLTVVIGIASIGDVKKVGKLGLKTIIYFEVITTLAMVLGIIVTNIFEPGKGMDISKADSVDISKYLTKASQVAHASNVDFVMGVIPSSFVGAFADNDLLQVLFAAVLFGVALAGMGEKAKPVNDLLNTISKVFFGIINILMKLAPLAAYGAMAHMVATLGTDSLGPLLKLIFYALLTMCLFVFGVLLPIGMYYKINILKLIRYIKDELLIVIGTGSSETVLPRVMGKMEKLGCNDSVVGFVIPTGYSFNLDGTSIYLAMSVIFIAQAFGVDLTLGQQLSVIGVMLLTSKGAAGVAGTGFIVLAATVQTTGIVPVQAIGILLGIDRIMSSVRAVVNLIGNSFATMLMAKIENELDESQTLAEYRQAFNRPDMQTI